MQNFVNVLMEYIAKLNFPGIGVIDVVEIFLISFFVYQFMVWIKFTRAYSLLKGILVVMEMCIRDSVYPEAQGISGDHGAE